MMIEALFSSLLLLSGWLEPNLDGYKRPLRLSRGAFALFGDARFRNSGFDCWSLHDSENQFFQILPRLGSRLNGTEPAITANSEKQRH